ncbi:MAG TPA: glycosyltransferase [Vicinamibacterales bacterium]|nr:glycosyltransferase [Vicinamibacterales bacterium]
MTARIVSVIPCFNSAQFVGQAIESALRQTVRDHRVVVVDDGSTDDFAEAVAPFDGRIDVIRQPQRGVWAARNAALAATDSELVAYLDADDMWVPAKLESQLDHMNRHPTVGMVHTGVEFIDQEGKLLSVTRREPVPASGMVGMVTENRVCTSSVLHKREAFDDEYFSREVRGPCEDWDLWLRIAGRGYGVSYISQPLTRYRLHTANASRRAESMLIGTVDVMDRLLSRQPQAAVKRAAVLARAKAFCDLGNIAYSRRDLRSARSLYFKGLRAAGRGELRRIVFALAAFWW